MTKSELRTVEMTREIRAMHAEEFRGASLEERVEFYRQKSGRLAEEAEEIRRMEKRSA